MNPSLPLPIGDIIHSMLSRSLAISAERVVTMRLGSAYSQWLSVQCGLHLLHHSKRHGLRPLGNTQINRQPLHSKIIRH